MAAAPAGMAPAAGNSVESGTAAAKNRLSVEAMLDSNLLRSLPFLSLLGEREMTFALPRLRRRTAPPRTRIIRAGATSDGLYILLSGSVKVYFEDHHGHEIIVEELFAPEIFGEGGVLNAQPGGEIVESQVKTELVHVPRSIASECLERNPAAALFLSRVLTRRLANAHRKIASFAFDDVHARVATLLLERSREESGIRIVDASTNYISAVVGASREMVGRVMKNLKDQGVIRREKRRIIVADSALLAACANGERPAREHRNVTSGALSGSPSKPTRTPHAAPVR